MHSNPFAAEAAEYAHLRPDYPEGLFGFLASVAPSRGAAWDCATGNGQAARHLSHYFDRIIATDQSAEMVAQAVPDPAISYRVATAEDSGLEAASVDLITVASAIHWFDLDAFYAEVRRVAKPGGTLAAWTYYTPVLGEPMDGIVRHLVHDVLGGYWDERVHYVVDEFHDLPFPFEQVASPTFHTDMEWDLRDLLGYFETWSASLKYRAAKGTRPTGPIDEDLERAWGDPGSKRNVCFPLYMRLGRMQGLAA